MEDAVDKARRQRNVIEEIAAKIPGFKGYGDRELRREVDALLRTRIGEVLDEARRHIKAALRALPLTAAARVGRLGSIEKELDAAANAARHAGSGYAGFFDAYKIAEPELERLYTYDLELLAAAERLRDVAARESDVEAGMQSLDDGVASLRRRLAERPQVVRAAFAIEEGS